MQKFATNTNGVFQSEIIFSHSLKGSVCFRFCNNGSNTPTPYLKGRRASCPPSILNEDFVQVTIQFHIIFVPN